MKILHTADWHVHPRHVNCGPALERLVEVVDEVKPDLVIHDGDVFDTRGRIDPASIELVRSTTDRIRRRAPMFFIPGNQGRNRYGPEPLSDETDF